MLKPLVLVSVVKALELKEHLKKQAKSLSAGLKRKVRTCRRPSWARPRPLAPELSPFLFLQLCFALSMIGNPQVVLLDEPSSGMDSKSKQRMWWGTPASIGPSAPVTPPADTLTRHRCRPCRRAIRAAFKNQQRCAVLTTHYMEEAEAVCDRVAIMVSGQLRWAPPPHPHPPNNPGSSCRPYLSRPLLSPARCIGTIQHLKGKYGRGYSLEVKLREELTGLQRAELLHKDILRIFPHALRQER